MVRALYRALLQVYYNKADVGANVAFNAGINKLFDYVFYGYEEYYFVGHKPETLPQIKNLSYPFDNSSWLFALVSLILYVAFAILVQSVHKVSAYLISLVICLYVLCYRTLNNSRKELLKMQYC